MHQFLDYQNLVRTIRVEMPCSGQVTAVTGQILMSDTGVLFKFLSEHLKKLI